MMFFLPQGRYPENFLLIYQLEEGLEGGGQEGGYLEDVDGVPDQRLGGQCHP